MKTLKPLSLILLFAFSIGLFSSCAKVREIKEAKERARSEKVQSVIKDLYAGIQKYRIDNLREPVAVDEVYSAGYWDPGLDMMDQWKFSILVVDTTIEINAYSTEEFKDGANHRIKWDLGTRVFTGYGTPEGEEYSSQFN